MAGGQTLSCSVYLVLQFSDFVWGGFGLNFTKTSLIHSVADFRLVMVNTSLMVLGLTSPKSSIKLGLLWALLESMFADRIFILVSIDHVLQASFGFWPS